MYLKELKKLEDDEKIRKTHTVYNPEEYGALVANWTNQAVQKLINSEDYISYQNVKEKDQ